MPPDPQGEKREAEAGLTRLQRTQIRILHFYFRLARGLTLGVRAVVLNDRGEVFLIRHTYTPGWQFPGGGVEVGETLADALATRTRRGGADQPDGASGAAWRLLQSQGVASRPCRGLCRAGVHGRRGQDARSRDRRGGLLPARGAAGRRDAGDAAAAGRDRKRRAAGHGLVSGGEARGDGRPPAALLQPRDHDERASPLHLATTGALNALPGMAAPARTLRSPSRISARPQVRPRHDFASADHSP